MSLPGSDIADLKIVQAVTSEPILPEPPSLPLTAPNPYYAEPDQNLTPHKPRKKPHVVGPVASKQKNKALKARVDVSQDFDFETNQEMKVILKLCRNLLVSKNCRSLANRQLRLGERVKLYCHRVKHNQ
jgi:hypothetical protein